MYYKIQNNILRRNEKNSLMILHPISKKLMIFKKEISDFVSKGGIIDGDKIENRKIIDGLIRESIVFSCKKKIDIDNEKFGSDPVVSAPLNITIQITNRCNLKCKHCHRTDKGYIDFDKERFIKLVDELYDMKVFNINISGGEPLLYKGLSDIIKYIVTKGIKVTLSTNLMLWDEDVAKKMYQLGIRQIHVSLDSANKEYHNYIRGSEESYLQTIKNLEIIRKVGISYTLVTTLVNQTLEDYANVIDLAYDLGASSHKTNILVPQGQGGNLEVGYYKDKKLLKSYISIFLEKKKEYNKRMSVIGETMFMICIGENFDEKPDILKILCPAGVLTGAITEKGELLPCPFYSEINAGNIFESSFKDLWKNNNIIKRIRNDKFTNDNSGCQARAYGKTKQIESDDPYCYKKVYKVDDYGFYNNSAKKRNDFISKIGHSIKIEGEKGNKEFYGLIHNYLLNSESTLEIGTGNGIVPKTLGKLGKKITSIDFSDNMLEIAKSNCAIYPNVTFRKEDIHSLSFEDNLFDLVIKRLAPDDLNQVFRVLRPGGKFINFTNGEKDGRELKEIFEFAYHESVYEYKSKLKNQGFNLVYEDEFEFKEIYSDPDTLINMLNIAPIIPDFLEREEYYIDKIKKIFDTTSSFILTRHKYLVNAEKPTV